MASPSSTNGQMEGEKPDVKFKEALNGSFRVNPPWKKLQWKKNEMLVKANVRKSNNLMFDDADDDVVKMIFGDNGKSTSITKFIIIDVCGYCSFQDGRISYFLPGEIALAAFSVDKGISDVFSTFVDPGSIPFGSRLGVKQGVLKTGLKPPGFDKELQDYSGILQKFEDFIRNHLITSDEWPPLFCLQENISSVNGSLHWLYNQVYGTKGSISLRLLPLEKLLYYISDLGSKVRATMDKSTEMKESEEVKETRKTMQATYGLGGLDLTPVVPSTGRFNYFPEPKDGGQRTGAETTMERLGKFCSIVHARSYLKTSAHNAFNEQLACDFHKKPQNQDPGLQFCSLLIVRRLAMNMYDALHPIFNFSCLSGKVRQDEGAYREGN